MQQATIKAHNDAELDQLTNVDDADRDEARRLLETLRGKAIDVSGQVMTGAGGGLLATIIGRLIGLG